MSEQALTQDQRSAQRIRDACAELNLAIHLATEEGLSVRMFVRDAFKPNPQAVEVASVTRAL